MFRSNTDMVLLTTRLRIDRAGNRSSRAAWSPGETSSCTIPPASTTQSCPRRRPTGKRLTTFWKHCSGSAAKWWTTNRCGFSWPSAIWSAAVPFRWTRSPPSGSLRDWHEYGAQYSIFAEVSDISPATIVRFLDTPNPSTASKTECSEPTLWERYRPWWVCGRSSIVRAAFGGRRGQDAIGHSNRFRKTCWGP